MHAFKSNNRGVKNKNPMKFLFQQLLNLVLGKVKKLRIKGSIRLQVSSCNYQGAIIRLQVSDCSYQAVVIKLEEETGASYHYFKTFW